MTNKCNDCSIDKNITHIKANNGKLNVNSILDTSKRTISKIMKRMNIPCSYCGISLGKNVVLDIHHIKEKKNKVEQMTWII